MAITFAARMLMFSTSGRNRRSNPLGMLALMILAPLAATLLQLALSRSRESEADRSGADLIGTGIPLASALQKLERGAAIVPMDVEPARSSAYIVNPLTGRSVSFAGLFSTHPPTQQRIAALIDEDRTLSRQR
jgi:heat shock protein HtpX